jgi:hypothetical protein
MSDKGVDSGRKKESSLAEKILLPGFALLLVNGILPHSQSYAASPFADIIEPLNGVQALQWVHCGLLMIIIIVLLGGRR